MKKYVLWSLAGLIGVVAACAIGFFGFIYAIEHFAQPEPMRQLTGQVSSKRQERKKASPPNAIEVFELVNEERARVGVEPLIIDEAMNASARFKAEDMKSRDYFSHRDPSTGLENGLDKIDELTAGRCTYVGENIQRNGLTNTSKAAFESWKNSPAHYEAMINADYVSTGVGVAGVYVVQHFCY